MGNYKKQAIDMLECNQSEFYIKKGSYSVLIVSGHFIEILEALKEERQTYSKGILIKYFLFNLVVESLKLTNYEKMRLYFDMLRPYVEYYSDDKNKDNFDEEKKDLSIDKMITIICSSANKDLDNVSPWFLDQLNEIIYCRNNLKNMQNEFKTLKELYYDQSGEPSIEDLKKITESLKAINLPESTIKSMTNALQKHVRKPKMIKHTYQQQAPTKRLLNEQEWKSLNKKINNEYYELRKRNPIKALDILEKIELSALLKIIGYKDQEINEILREIDFKYRDYDTKSENGVRNALILKAIYQKYCSQMPDPQIQYENMKNILREIRLTKDLEEREFWKEMMIEQLTKAERYSKGNYAYELKQAKKILNRSL